MSIMRCPTCNDAVYIAKAARVGQIITCDSCEEILKITSIQPVTLQIFEIDQEDDEENLQTPVRPSSIKKGKKNDVVSSEISVLKDEIEDLSEERKQEKKKRKQLQRQKIEYFDE